MSDPTASKGKSKTIVNPPDKITQAAFARLAGIKCNQITPQLLTVLLWREIMDKLTELISTKHLYQSINVAIDEIRAIADLWQPGDLPYFDNPLSLNTVVISQMEQ